MRSGRKVRSLMLGWEYPPRFAGGLGKACRGLSLAMARQGAQVFFVLPTFPDRISEERLEVVEAREAMIESGWQNFPDDDISQITRIHTDAQMFPYGEHPSGPIPERLKTFIASQADPGERGRATERMNTSTSIRKIKASTEPGKSSEIYGKNLWREIERFCFSVRQLSETHEVDVIHAHDWMTFPAAFEFQRMTGAPVFLHVHATEYDRSGESLNNDVFRIEREGFRKATHIFAVSRYTAGIIERLYGIDRKKISVIYNAPDEDAKHLTVSPDAPRQPQVIFLGRLTFQKGPDHFLKAAALVAEVLPEARFLMCGTGDMFDKLRAMAHSLGIERQTHFTGFLNPSHVDQILQESKVLVMPSVSEPFGLVALEAIHCGIPVILSKQSGVREVLHRALQVDFWDHERLADQMIAALTLRALSRQLVAEGMDQVQQLTWDKSAKKIIEIYKEHLGMTYAQAVGGAHGH